MGMDQYLLIRFLGGWTSIYQLFWCELQGYKVLTHCHIIMFYNQLWAQANCWFGIGPGDHQELDEHSYGKSQFFIGKPKVNHQFIWAVASMAMLNYWRIDTYTIIYILYIFVTVTDVFCHSWMSWQTNEGIGHEKRYDTRSLKFKIEQLETWRFVT